MILEPKATLIFMVGSAGMLGNLYILGLFISFILRLWHTTTLINPLMARQQQRLIVIAAMAVILMIGYWLKKL